MSTPCSTIPSSRVTVPVTFWVYVCSGRDTDTPAYLNPARCTTPDTFRPSEASSTAGRSTSEPTTSGTDSGTKSRWPLDRSSRTTQSMPSCRNARTTCEPM